ncbi:hypothetical protein EFN43_08285 [Pediococcus pentosaceus]|uniref:hypothetical protein n=1 Tax=Pediococcus pentosaceus TaxID=1255 RepID=UPI0021A3ABAD|nr:hypothetical protein [Pediococcus pentosaceus]MCT3021054.1 hypothetical protein [Pediococcus pentosaceus]
MDNSVKRTMAWYPLEPYGFFVTYIDEGEKIPDEVTLIEPPAILRPKFNFDTQKWETAPEEPTAPTDTQIFLKAVTGQLADHCEALDEANARIGKLEAVIKKDQTKLGGN